MRGDMQIGSTEALWWAWGKQLPPKQKLMLLYLADGYREPKSLDYISAGTFASIATHEVRRTVRALRAAGLVEIDGDIVQIRYEA